MLTFKELQTLMSKQYPYYVIETCFENKVRFVCSLRHKTMRRGASTGAACYLVNKSTNQITVYSVTDKMVRKLPDDIIRI